MLFSFDDDLKKLVFGVARQVFLLSLLICLYKNFFTIAQKQSIRHE